MDSSEAYADIVGPWNGKVEIGATAVPIVLRIAHDDAGLTVLADLPQFGRGGVVYGNAAFARGVLTFTSNSLGDYVGRLDGDHIAGAFAKGGDRYALTLARGDAELAAPHRPQTPQPPFDYAIEDVFVDRADAGCRLAGTLTRPFARPHAVALLITGSGAMDRDETVFGHQPFRVIADCLTRRGYAVLRLDDRGVGASTGDRTSLTLADETDDMAAAFDLLAHRADLRGAPIGLIGHSAGSGIARLLAARRDDVAFVVSLAGVGVAFDAALADRECRLIAQREWSDTAGIERHRAFTFAIYRELAERPDDVPLDAAQVDAIAQRFDAVKTAASFFVPAWIERCNTRWLRSLLRFDPVATALRVRAPLLALNGERDTQVPATSNLAALADAFAVAGNEDVTIVPLPGLNHLFQTCTTGEAYEYPQIDETFAPHALNAIVDWLDRRFAR